MSDLKSSHKTTPSIESYETFKSSEAGLIREATPSMEYQLSSYENTI